MKLFNYRAVDADGHTVAGRIDAMNIVDLEMRLRRMTRPGQGRTSSATKPVRAHTLSHAANSFISAFTWNTWCA